MQPTLIPGLNPSQTTAILICTVVGTVLGLIWIVTAITTAWQSVRKGEAERSLKAQMLDKGFSAEEIVSVLRAGGKPRGTDLPSPTEVVVKWTDGEWYPALILKEDDDRFWVHYIGHDMSSNEWVSVDRIRFPAAPRDGVSNAGEFASTPRHKPMVPAEV